MHLPKLATGLVTSLLLCGNAFGLRVPVKDVREHKKELEKRTSLDQRDAAAELQGVFHEHEKRIVCIENDLLLSLQAYPEDSAAFCSSYIGIQDTTTTMTDSGKTTVTVIGTTVVSVGETTTVPASTVTVTATTPMKAMLQKRQSPGITPAASIFSSCSQTPQNSSLISAVSSGCSCLFLTPGTTVATTTALSTRTLVGVDHREATVATTVTSGTTTVTLALASSGGTGSASIVNSGNSTVPTGTGSSGRPAEPSVTGFSSGTGYSGYPIQPTDTRGGGMITSSTTTMGPRTTTYPPSGVSASPTGIKNGTSSIGTAFSSGTGIILPPSNTTIASPTGTGYPPLQGCPGKNGSTYITQCQEFEIECYINYSGPTNQGLSEPDLYDCINGCAIANVGFSELRCYAASYIPSASGPNCFFKTYASSLAPYSDGTAVSALLISNNTCAVSSSISNATSTRVPSASSGFPVSSNSTMMSGATGSGGSFSIPSPTFNVSSRAGPTLPTLSSYTKTEPTTTGPSMMPSASMNGTISSGFPTSSNMTFPSPTNSRSGNSTSCAACTTYATSTLFLTSIIYQTSMVY